MPPTASSAVLSAVSTPWPVILAAVAVVVAVCLWLLFRPGSMADRARHDHPEGDIADAMHPDGTGSDGTSRPEGDVGHPPDGGR